MLEELAENPIPFAMLFAIIQLVGMFAFIRYLREIKRKGLPLPPEGPNPFNRPIVVVIIGVIALGVTGLDLTVGPGWTLIIELPTFILGILAARLVAGGGRGPSAP